MTERPQRPWHLYLLGGIAILVIALGVAEVGPPTSSARTSRQTVTAERGVVQSTVSGTGNVAAGTDLDVDFRTSGTLAHVYVKTGEHVHKGQLLATLDPTSARLGLEQAELSLTSAEDQLASAGNGSSSGSSGSSSSGSNNSGSSATSASLTASSSTATEYVSDTTRTPSTEKTSSATTTTSSRTTTAPSTTPTPPTTTTQTATTTAPRTTTTQTAAPTGSATPSASSAGQSSGAVTTSTTSSAASIASAEASVVSAEASVKTAEATLADTKLYAPIGGTIVSLSSLQPGDSVSAGSTSSASSSSASSSATSSTGTSAGSLGGSSSSTGSSGSTSSSSSFAEIVNTGSMTMTVAFSESDISKVKVGQSATVTLDALTGVELAAHVSAISTVGTTSSSVVSYDATLTLDQHDARVKPGMSASASVITGQTSGVTVPNDAVTGSGTLASVNALRGGKSVTEQVVVGLKGDSRTEIVSGLPAGAQVVVTTSLPSLGSSGTANSGSSGTLGGSGGFGTRGLGGGGFGGGGFAGGGFAGGGPPAGGFPGGG